MLSIKKPKFTRKVILKIIVAITITVLSIISLVMNKLYSLQINLNFKENTTNINVGLLLFFIFKKDKFQLSIKLNSDDLENIFNLPKYHQIISTTIKYSDINNKKVLTDKIFEIILPVTQKIINFGEKQGIIINPEQQKSVEVNIYNNIKLFIDANKEILDTVAYYIKIINIFMYAIIPFFLFNAIYMVFNMKRFIVSIILFILTLLLSITLTVLVFVVPKLVNNINNNISVKVEYNLISHVTTSYLGLLMFLIHAMMI
jgi:hypothetical protein